MLSLVFLFQKLSRQHSLPSWLFFFCFSFPHFPGLLQTGATQRITHIKATGVLAFDGVVLVPWELSQGHFCRMENIFFLSYFFVVFAFFLRRYIQHI